MLWIEWVEQMELNYIELTWPERNWIELHVFDTNWIEMVADRIELDWTELERPCVELE